MQKRLVYLGLWVGVSLAFSSSVYADPGAPAIAADGWAGKTIMAKTAQVVLHEHPDAESPEIAYSLCGVLLTVSRAEQGWLYVSGGWVHAADVVPLDQAIEFFTAQLAQAESEFAFLGRARGRLKQGDGDRALADVSNALLLAPQSSRAVLVQARIAEDQGRNDDALAGYDRAAQLNPHDPLTFGARSNLWAKRGDYDRAIADLSAAIALLPSDAALWDQRGWCYLGKRDLDRASSDLSEAIRIDPHDAFAYSRRAAMHSNRRQYDLALADAEMAVRLDPRHLGALMGRAFFWVWREDDEKALQALTEVIDVGPASADVYERRAYIRMERGEHELAVDDLSAALRIEPKNADRLLLRALEWNETGNVEKALDDCHAALAIDPKKLMAYYHMACAHSRAGQFDQAIEDFDTALRIDPGDVEMRLLRADELVSQEKFDLALADVDEIIRSGKNLSKAHGWRGFFWALREDWQKAVADYNEALRLEPDDALLLAQRSACWTELNEFDKALQDAEQALRLDPKLTEAAEVRKEAIAAKNGEPRRSRRGEIISGPAGILTVTSATAIAPEPTAITPEYDIEVRMPSGASIALEDSLAQQFHLARLPVPLRLPMVGGGSVRFKLLHGKSDAGNELYARIQAEKISPEQIATLKKAAPRFVLTDADLDMARSGTDVIQLLILPTRADGQTSKPPAGSEFEILKSGPDLRGDALLAEAHRRGIVAIELRLSQRLPPLFDGLVAPSDDNFVPFSVNGPAGVILRDDLLIDGEFSGTFRDEPLPTPAHFRLMPGISIRFQLTGAPLPDAKPLYGVLTATDRWPDGLRRPHGTEFPIHLSKADLEAAAAGNDVTHVIYLAKEALEQGLSGITTMKSAAMPPGSDLIAEASKRGSIVAVVKLSKELPKLPGKLAK